MVDYRTIITAVGQTKLAAAILGPAIVLEKMAVGDANGVGYDPDEEQTSLVNEVYIADLDSVETLAGGVIVCEMTVPADQGGWHVREACVKDDDGDIIAIARISDRYKPLPASGQADELTIRMKFDVGNVGNVTWVVDLTRKAKIDGQLRPDFRSVDSIKNTPPAATAGDTWIVGDTPTGAWVGHENELVEWSGSGWTFIDPTPWMHVGLADKTDWRWDHTLETPAWIQWKASQTLAGPARLATLGEAGDANNLVNPLTPGTLAARMTIGFREIHVYTTSTTWIKPVDPRFVGIDVRVIGGGASGGVSNSGTADPLFGGGGSNGAEIVDYYRASELGVSSYSVTVGTGGASVAHAGAPADGNAGGASAALDLQANGGNPGSGLGGLHGAGGAAQSSGAVRAGKSLLISGTRGADGFEVAGITFPTSMGSIGQGGQGGYKTAGGPNSASGAGGNGVVIITEYYT